MHTNMSYGVTQTKELQAEIERAHKVLDREGVPRDDDHGRPLPLALRIAVLAEAGKGRHV